MLYKEILQKIKQYADRMHKTYAPEVKNSDLVDNGAIYYQNGNDGTSFDWEANGRTCEFFKFYKETELGLLKVYVTVAGEITGYLWKDLGEAPAIKLPPERLLDPFEAYTFMCRLRANRDYRNKYDEVIIPSDKDTDNN